MNRQIEPGDILEILTEHLADDNPSPTNDRAESRAAIPCLSCGAKTDPYGNLPCGH